MDALDVMRSIPDFAKAARATISVNLLRLPSGDVVGLVDVKYLGPVPEMVCIVSLPTSSEFRAVRRTSSKREYFEIGRLDGSTVDDMANVLLSDGTALRSVEVVPASLPLDPSSLDWRIVRHTISMIGAEQRCYRGLSDDLGSGPIKYLAAQMIV